MSAPTRILSTGVTVMVVCGIATVAVALLAGFERVNDMMLLVSSVLLFGPVLAVLAHLAFTRTLDRSQKRLWLRQLTGPRALVAWSEYLTCEDLSETAIRLDESQDPRT